MWEISIVTRFTLSVFRHKHQHKRKVDLWLLPIRKQKNVNQPMRRGHRGWWKHSEIICICGRDRRRSCLSFTSLNGHFRSLLSLFTIESKYSGRETATNNFYGRLETRRQRNEKCGSIQGNYVTASVMTFHTPWSQSRRSWPCTCHVPGIMMNGATLLSIFESLRDNILSHMYFSPFLLVDRGWPGGE